MNKWIYHGYTDKYGFHITDSLDVKDKKNPWKVKKKYIFDSYGEALHVFEKKYGHQTLLQYYNERPDYDMVAALK